jgi:ankyrin repeat protein
MHNGYPCFVKEGCDDRNVNGLVFQSNPHHGAFGGGGGSQWVIFQDGMKMYYAADRGAISGRILIRGKSIPTNNDWNSNNGGFPYPTFRLADDDTDDTADKDPDHSKDLIAITNTTGYSVLEVALNNVDSVSEALIWKMLEVGGSNLVLRRCGSHGTVLHKAMAQGVNIAILKKMVMLGGLPLTLALDKDGNTAIHCAVAKTEVAIAPDLILAMIGVEGADAEPSYSPYSPAERACPDDGTSIGYSPSSRQWHQKQAAQIFKPLLCRDQNGFTPLHAAIAGASNVPEYVLVQMLDLGGEALMLAQAKNGHTVVHAACAQAKSVPEGILRRLVTSTADQLLHRSASFTPIDCTVQNLDGWSPPQLLAAPQTEPSVAGEDTSASGGLLFGASQPPTELEKKIAKLPTDITMDLVAGAHDLRVTSVTIELVHGGRLPGCDASCSEQHEQQTCHICQQSWQNHNGHSCRGTGTRGSFDRKMSDQGGFQVPFDPKSRAQNATLHVARPDGDIPASQTASNKKDWTVVGRWSCANETAFARSKAVTDRNNTGTSFNQTIVLDTPVLVLAGRTRRLSITTGGYCRVRCSATAEVNENDAVQLTVVGAGDAKSSQSGGSLHPPKAGSVPAVSLEYAVHAVHVPPPPELLRYALSCHSEISEEILLYLINASTPAQLAQCAADGSTVLHDRLEDDDGAFASSAVFMALLERGGTGMLECTKDPSATAPYTEPLRKLNGVSNSPSPDEVDNERSASIVPNKDFAVGDIVIRDPSYTQALSGPSWADGESRVVSETGLLHDGNMHFKVRREGMGGDGHYVICLALMRLSDVQTKSKSKKGKKGKKEKNEIKSAAKDPNAFPMLEISGSVDVAVNGKYTAPPFIPRSVTVTGFGGTTTTARIPSYTQVDGGCKINREGNRWNIQLPNGLNMYYAREATPFTVPTEGWENPRTAFASAAGITVRHVALDDVEEDEEDGVDPLFEVGDTVRILDDPSEFKRLIEGAPITLSYTTLEKTDNAEPFSPAPAAPVQVPGFLSTKSSDPTHTGLDVIGTSPGNMNHSTRNLVDGNSQSYWETSHSSKPHWICLGLPQHIDELFIFLKAHGGGYEVGKCTLKACTMPTTSDQTVAEDARHSARIIREDFHLPTESEAIRALEANGRYPLLNRSDLQRGENAIYLEIYSCGVGPSGSGTNCKVVGFAATEKVVPLPSSGLVASCRPRNCGQVGIVRATEKHKPRPIRTATTSAANPLPSYVVSIVLLSGEEIQCPESACYAAKAARPLKKKATMFVDAGDDKAQSVDIVAMFGAGDVPNAPHFSKGRISAVYAALESHEQIAPDVLLRMITLGGGAALRTRAPGEGWTALHRTLAGVNELSPEVLTRVLDVGGSELLLSAATGGNTVLHSIVMGRIEVQLATARALLQKGGRPLAAMCDDAGRSPLHAFLHNPTEEPTPDVVTVLLDLVECGGAAVLSLKDVNGNTPLHSAVSHAKLIPSTVMARLLEFDGGTLVLARGYGGATPLHTVLACVDQTDDSLLLHRIVEASSRKNNLLACDDSKNSPLGIALQQPGMPADVLLRLLELGGDPLVDATKGKFPLDVARAFSAHVPAAIVETLLDLGGGSLVGVGWSTTEMGRVCCHQLQYFARSVAHHFSTVQITKVIDVHVGPARAARLVLRWVASGRECTEFQAGTLFGSEWRHSKQKSEASLSSIPLPAPPGWHNSAAGVQVVACFTEVCKAMAALDGAQLLSTMEECCMPLHLTQLFASIGRAGHTIPAAGDADDAAPRTTPTLIHDVDADVLDDGKPSTLEEMEGRFEDEEWGLDIFG